MNQLERIKANFKAIRASWDVTFGGFPLTEERIALISNFKGWGGCNAMLLPLDKDWKKLGESKEHLKAEKEVKKGYQELKNLFGDEQVKEMWKSITNASLTSFYTPQEIPKTFFEELKKQNEDKEFIDFLDPCAGIGVYIDACLEQFPKAEITAVEKDLLTSFVLSAKYKDKPNVKVVRKGFEEVKFNKEFDVIASNIPFGNFSVAFPQYDKKITDKIHNFFFHHSQNLLKDNGILSFITSEGVFNSPENQIVREELLKEGNITNFKVLPNDTFETTQTASHLVTYKKNKSLNGINIINQNDFIPSLTDSNGVKLNTYIANAKEKAYIAPYELDKDQYGKLVYNSKIGDFSKAVRKLEEDWQETSLVLKTIANEQTEEYKQPLRPLTYPPKKVANLNTTNTNLIEELQFIRKGQVPNNLEDFKIIATVRAKENSETTIPLLTVATAYDKQTKQKVYFYQSDVENFSFTKFDEQWIGVDTKQAINDALEQLHNISESYQLQLQLDFRRDADGQRFADYFEKNYKKVNLEFAYTKALDFHFHRQVQENDVFVTKKGNVAQIVEIDEIKPDINAEFPLKKESYKVKPIEVVPTDKEKVVELLNLYSTYSLMITEHQQYRNGVEWSLEHLQTNQAALNKVYDDFEAKYGKINSKENKSFLEQYKDLFRNHYYVLLALENNVEERIDPELPLEEGNIKESWEKSDIFHYNYEKDFNQEVDINTALVRSFTQYGKINIDYIAGLSKKEENEVLEALSEYIILNPLTSEYELKDTFLKGNMYEKREAIELLPDSNAKNDALMLIEEYFPERKPFENIVFQMGSRWIPVEIYKEFLESHFNTEFKINFSPKSDELYLSLEGKIDYQKWHRKKMGNGRYFDSLMMIEHAFYNTSYIVKKTEKYTDENGKVQERKIQLYDDTAECNRHIRNLRDAFVKYVKNLSPEKREKIADIYNKRFNNTAKPIDINYSFYRLGFDFESLKTLGITKEYAHQIEGSWQAVRNNGGIIDHEVGYGKTLTLIGTAHNLKKYGKAKLPLILGLPANVNEIARTYKLAYPNARILYAGNNFSKNKEDFFNKMRNNEYDVVIMSHTQIAEIPISDEIYLEEKQKEAEKMTDNLNVAQKANDYSLSSVRAIKELEKSILKVQNEIDYFKHNIESGKNKNIPTLENLGIDHIIIDESHKFKNAGFSTRHTQVKGIGKTDGSGRANVLRYAIRSIQKKNNSDFGATFFSGTPISNALSELYILQDYLTPKLLEERGIANFDAWVSTFVEKTAEIETNMVGAAVITERFRKYMNIPELSEMYNQLCHTRRGDTEFLKRPIQDVQSIVNELTPLQKKFNAKLIKFLESRGQNENDLKLETELKRDGNEVAALSLITTNLAWKASLDMRLINPNYLDDPHSKVNYMIETVLDRYKRYNEGQGTQIIFCTESISKQKLSYEQMKYNYEHNIFTSVYDDIKYKLMSRGIPENEIAFVQDYNTDKKKAQLSKLMNEGKIRFLIGNYGNAGTGINVQKKLCGVTHLTLPWTPAELEQGNGRIYRQGNEIVRLMNNNHCEIRMCATKGTLDIYKSEFLARKAKFIEQIRNRNKDVFVLDEGELGGEEMAMDMATLQSELSGDITVLEKAKVDKELSQLTQTINTIESNQRLYSYRIDTLKGELKAQKDVLNIYQRDFDKAAPLIEYKDDKRVNKPIVPEIPSLEELYNEETFANYLKGKYEEIRKANINDKIIVGELYGFDMVMQRSVDIVQCYIQSKEAPYLNYSYNASTISPAASNTAIANYFSNCIGSLKNKLASQERGVQKKQEELEKAEIDLKREMVTPQMYDRQKELQEKQEELTKKLVASGGIRKTANYEISQMEILVGGYKRPVNVYTVTSDLKELDRALLYDQFGREGEVGCVYLKKDTEVYDLMVNKLNGKGITLRQEPLFDKEKEAYFVMFDINDVDKLYVNFCEITNPREELLKISLENTISPIQELTEAPIIAPIVESNIGKEGEQLSLFESSPEPIQNVYEEGEEEVEKQQIQKTIEASNTSNTDIPQIYGQDEVEPKDKLVYKIFFIPGYPGVWYMNEFDPETNEGFGLCAMEYPEWGYFSLDELAKEDAQEIVVNPPQTYEQLLETELRANLSSEELERVFYGKLTFEEDLWKNLPDEPGEEDSIKIEPSMKAVNKETGEEFVVSKVTDKYIDLKQEYGSNIAKVITLNFEDVKTITEQYNFYNSDTQKNIKSNISEGGNDTPKEDNDNDNEQTQNTNNKPKKQL